MKKIELEETDAAFVLKENWSIEIAIPRQADDETVPKNAQFIACLLVLTNKDPEFVPSVWQRGEKMIAEAAESGGEHPLDSVIPKPSASRRRSTRRAEGDEHLRIEKSDAAFVLKDNWDIQVEIPLLERGDRGDYLPDHVSFIIILVALIKSNPEFVDYVWEHGEKFMQEVLEDNEDKT